MGTLSHTLRITIALALLWAPAAMTAPAATQPPKAYKSWTGVWVTVGHFGFDPSIMPPARQPVPYRPDWMQNYEQILAEAEKGNVYPDPMANCIPGGMPRMMNMPYPMEILATPKQVTIVSESLSQIRRIYIDGRKHPDNLWPTYYGHSIGHWEGDTLLVDTVKLRADPLIDQSGVRHSDQMTVSERMRLVTPDLFEDVITVNDPIAFEHPWTVTKHYKRDPKGEILEMVCEENNRNPIVNGKTQYVH